jgi:hypothetical protein
MGSGFTIAIGQFDHFRLTYHVLIFVRLYLKYTAVLTKVVSILLYFVYLRLE